MRMLALAIVLLVVLSGCAAMSPEECEFADWASLGEQDARQGRALDYLARRGKACSEAGVAVDRDAYRAGWDRGIEHFCQPQQGFDGGIGGHRYGRICPTDLEAAFLAGYELGAEIHGLRVERDQLDAEIRELEARFAATDVLDEREARSLRESLYRHRAAVREIERAIGQREGQAMALGYRL